MKDETKKKLRKLNKVLQYILIFKSFILGFMFEAISLYLLFTGGCGILNLTLSAVLLCIGGVMMVLAFVVTNSVTINTIRDITEEKLK